MKMSTNKTARKVKAAAIGAPAGVIGSYVGMRLAIPDLPDEVDAAIMALVASLLSWLLGFKTKPHSRDTIVHE